MADPPAIATSEPVRASWSIDPLVFSQATGNAIHISDPDVGNLPVQVTLATDFGTLSLSGAEGLDVLRRQRSATAPP